MIATPSTGLSYPKLLPSNKLRRRPLVPFVEDGLRTGGCLFPLWWRREPTFFIVQKQYERLKQLHPTPTITPKVKISDELLVETDAFVDYRRHSRPDVLSDRDWYGINRGFHNTLSC